MSRLSIPPSPLRYGMSRLSILRVLAKKKASCHNIRRFSTGVGDANILGNHRKQRVRDRAIDEMDHFVSFWEKANMNFSKRFLFALAFVGMLFVFTNCSKDSETCKTNDDCSSGVCQEGKCVGNNSEGALADGGNNPEKNTVKSCKTDADCPLEERCANKKCVPLPDKCKDKSECREGQICNPKTHKCSAVPCSFDEQCPEKQACNKKLGKCEPAQSCKENKDCPPSYVCNTCRHVCTLSSIPNCKKGENCPGKCDEDYHCPGGIELEWCDKCVHECRPRKKICSPCVKNEECGDKDDYCLPDQSNPKSGLKFCSRKCQNDTFCTAGFVCKKFPNLKAPYQCVPASGNCKRPAECESNAECASKGKVCDPATKLCVTGCDGDANCPVRKFNNCKSDADCTDPRAKCIAGFCSIHLRCCRSRCGMPCSSDSECDANETCDHGCCKMENECQSSKDCKEKHYCDQSTGLCVPGCQIDIDCGLPDPKKNRCRFKCKNNKCIEDCSCRNPQLDCEPVKFCPKDQTKPNAPCRKPVGPICKSCSSDMDCACKKGDDCKYFCARKECKQDTDCANMPGGATKCYNGRCATKKACRTTADCDPNLHEKCENGFCAENCNNRCIKLKSGARCFTGCDPKGDGRECPARLTCIELLPQSASGPSCPGKGGICKTDSDCSGKYKRCGPDGRCTACSRGKVCRNLDPNDSTKYICIPMPPTMCADFTGVQCKEAGY